MKQTDPFQELAKKAYLNDSHEDGMLDLIMGASCLGLCVFLAPATLSF